MDLWWSNRCPLFHFMTLLRRCKALPNCTTLEIRTNKIQCPQLAWTTSAVRILWGTMEYSEKSRRLQHWKDYWDTATVTTNPPAHATAYLPFSPMPPNKGRSRWELEQQKQWKIIHTSQWYTYHCRVRDKVKIGKEQKALIHKQPQHRPTHRIIGRLLG